MSVQYTGVICAGPDKGKMLTQSISSFSYEVRNIAPVLPFDPAQPNEPLNAERVTMMLFSIRMVQDYKLVNGITIEHTRTYHGIWVPVTWDERRCIAFLINCAASFLQREDCKVSEKAYKSNATNIGYDD